MSEIELSLLTPRLRLVPVGPANAADLWLVHNDDAVVAWYDGWRPSVVEADEYARWVGESWRRVHKWIAYERDGGEVVGRGGLSRTPIDEDWGQLYGFFPHEPWVREALDGDHRLRVHARWLEIGWALRHKYWGRGYASEIGHAGLRYAFDVLRARDVVSCIVRHNLRSRAVMERIGMRYAGEIYSKGTAKGEVAIRGDAPYAVSLILQADAER